MKQDDSESTVQQKNDLPCKLAGVFPAAGFGEDFTEPALGVFL
nr:hypothetical protein [Methylocella tundrae]